jgi:hypothetical protein
MFGFFKRKGMSGADHQQEFKRLADRMWNQHECDATPRDELLHAMAVIENEFAEHAGANWDDDDHAFYLNLVRDRLLAEASFSAETREKIEKAVKIIHQWGNELAESGHSAIAVKSSIEYLVTRVVEWCRKNP